MVCYIRGAFALDLWSCGSLARLSDVNVLTLRVIYGSISQSLFLSLLGI